MKHSQIEFQSALLAYRTVATIHEDVRGGPVRRIVNGRHHKPTGRYVSRKARRAMPWEDRAERKFFWLCEADADVVTYLAQPHCLEIHLQDGGSLTYYPDVRRDMADGSVQVRELKSKSFALRKVDPTYDRKLELAQEVYEGLGWDFDLLNEATDIDRPRVRLETAREIQRSSRVDLSPADRFVIIEAIEGAGGTLSLGELSTALGGGPAGRAKGLVAVIERIVRIHLDLPLEDGTEVTLVGERR